MIAQYLFYPPVAFIVVLLGMMLFSALLSLLAYQANKKERESRAYSCGEDFTGHLIQPDYSQFFSFAFFFTVLHVVALVITTIPKENVESLATAIVYLVVAVVGLVILLRK